MAPHSRGTPIIEPLIVKQELPDTTKLYHTRDQRGRRSTQTCWYYTCEEHVLTSKAPGALKLVGRPSASASAFSWPYASCTLQLGQASAKALLDTPE